VLTPLEPKSSRSSYRRAPPPLALAGIVIFFALSLVSHVVLRRRHERAMVREV
jgi:hypothetical protein